MEFTCKFADKHTFDPILPEIFEILRGNMELIAPTGDTYEEDFAIWREYIVSAMRDEQRQIVLMYCGEELAGYFQYNIHADSFMMEEIQIKPEYQGTGLFRELYLWLEKELPTGLIGVEAYSNKNNEKSQKILEHLGLKCVGKNKGGSSYHYMGNCQRLWDSFR